MGALYDRADIYDLIETEERFSVYRQHWEHMLGGLDVGTLLDVSIGSGSVTLPLLELGVAVSGSGHAGQVPEKGGGPGVVRGSAAERFPGSELLVRHDL